ncbi:TBCC domain-containing 1-like [Olea europaea subsp. europaea]|uniref:TBCC domain-containing 1-like n=1 Tax=Olea europaea subsp. europaea TaxID=158383 RepID=A0A8S0U8Y0_OLEEU|nr:TBCC domain-containing 1-like [Olea europaea subsp. europaea]
MADTAAEEPPHLELPSTSSNSTTKTASSTTNYLHPRREPFEHGLLPIPKLIFPDATQTLSHLKSTLLAADSSNRVNPVTLAGALQISIDHSRLILETLSSVLHDDSDPLVNAKTPQEIDSIGVNVFDLLVYLYIQSYKRLLPKGHKDSAAVADVWPSTSAFDGFLSALSPLQLVRSNSRRFMPSQADEEAHQLSYLQKHLGNIVSLLADCVEGEVEDSLVVSMDIFEHIGFLLYFGEKGLERSPLSQISPFFANSDPDMPAVPVPASQVLDWLLENVATALEHISERISLKENGPSSASDQDVTMADVSTSPAKALTCARGPSFIEGISKSSYLKQASDLKGSSVKVVNCHESVIYILAPLRYATVYGCSDATIVLGAVGKVAPYNTFYSQLEEHMNQVGIDPSINRWDEPVALGVVDPHDSLSHPAGVSDVQAESATRLDPDQYTNFLIPNWWGDEFDGSTKDNPFTLPHAYLASQQRNHKNMEEIKQILRETPLEDSRKRELSSALHVYFKDWLYASGNIRQLYCLQGE